MTTSTSPATVPETTFSRSAMKRARRAQLEKRPLGEERRVLLRDERVHVLWDSAALQVHQLAEELLDHAGHEHRKAVHERERLERGDRRGGVAPADCVVVEDSAVGVAAGAAAGMRVIALDRANALPQSFEGQTWKVRDLSEFDIEKEFGA